MKKLSIKDLDLKGKKVLIRVDYNVPMENEKITDDSRIQASLSTIRYAIENGASIILMSHLGRPDGKKDPKYSLKPCAKRLSELLSKEVALAPDCIGAKTEEMAQNLKPGEVLLLENLRFHPGEEHPENEPNFVDSLAKLGDIYINDAFGTAHRAHSSTCLIAQHFPRKAAMGFLMEKEITFLNKTVLDPIRPFIALIGGAKLSTKLKVIQSLIEKADFVLIGGAMAYTFLKAQGISIGNSLHEPKFLDQAKALLEQPKNKNRLLLPVDFVVTQKIEPNSKSQIVTSQNGIPEGWEGVDIGPQTTALYSEKLRLAKTVFWNGPVGVFECPPFDRGTNALAKTIANLDATTVIGGGDTVSAIEKLGLTHFSHISTGGGASLEYIELNGELPGITALSEKAVG